MITDVIILAGGVGSRLGEYGDKLPKPLVRVGGKPIIVHIMESWQRAGAEKFIIAGGHLHGKLLDCEDLQKFDHKVIYTGEETQTAGRLRRILPMLDDDVFGISYGDGVTSFDLSLLMDKHAQNDATLTMLVTRPIMRFGEVIFTPNGKVNSFSEKPVSDSWINAGYFIANKSIGDVPLPDEIPFETSPMEALVELGGVWAVQCNNFWHCMDTPKDVRELNKIWENNGGAWPQ